MIRVYILSYVEWVVDFVEQRDEKTMRSFESLRCQISRLEFGDETLQTRVKLEGQQEIQDFHSPKYKTKSPVYKHPICSFGFGFSFYL